MSLSFLTGICGDKRREIRMAVLPSDRSAFDTMMLNGDNYSRSLSETLGSSVKGKWTQGHQRALVNGITSGTMSAAEQLNHCHVLADRRIVNRTHGSYETSLKYFLNACEAWDLPGVLIPPPANPRGGAFFTIMTLLFLHLSATIVNSITKKKGESQGKTIKGHIARIRSMHQMIDIQWPCIKEWLQALSIGHDKQLIDINGVVPKKQAAPMNVELYRTLIDMEWPTEFTLEMKMMYLSLFLMLWEGLLRPAALIQTEPDQQFSSKWFMALSAINFVVPPERSMSAATEEVVLAALRVPGLDFQQI